MTCLRGPRSSGQPHHWDSLLERLQPATATVIAVAAFTSAGSS